MAVTEHSAASLTVSPPNRLRTILISVLVGAFITTIWSFTFVDSVIGDNVANSILGYDARETPIAGAFMGAVFAFVSGLAGTFTACNIACFSAIAPLAASKRSVADVVKPILWLSLGMVVVAGAYGAFGAWFGTDLPQLSSARVGPNGFPVRLIQSSVVFSIIGLVYILWGLVSLNVVRNPFANFSARYPMARLILMGALIGGFLIGRPFPLFRKMFEYAASTHNLPYGASVFILQALGNVVIMVALFLLITRGTGGRFERWLTAVPGRLETVTAVALIIAGVFFFTYWGLRLPARFGIGWWPSMPWS